MTVFYILIKVARIQVILLIILLEKIILFVVWVEEEIVLDNAIVENFFGTLKNESIYKKTLKNGKLTYKEMQKMIDEYIEYYNNRRIQERLGFRSPVNFRKEKELID